MFQLEHGYKLKSGELAAASMEVHQLVVVAADIQRCKSQPN
jgi:hypothetical protein